MSGEYECVRRRERNCYSTARTTRPWRSAPYDRDRTLWWDPPPYSPPAAPVPHPRIPNGFRVWSDASVQTLAPDDDPVPSCSPAWCADPHLRVTYSDNIPPLYTKRMTSLEKNLPDRSIQRRCLWTISWPVAHHGGTRQKCQVTVF